MRKYVILLVMVHTVSQDEHPIVQINSGAVQGVSTQDYDKFLGISYAASPVGRLRFQLPQPVQPWEGIFAADHYGIPAPSFAPQSFINGKDDLQVDENWLTVNVWTPKNAHNAPVFVWIHGGFFVSGSNADPLYDGSAFARDGVIVVAINYRLGVEGFGIFPDVPKNRGTADQIMALQWIKDNISIFGGDPHNITIGGQSAGAMSVGILLASPKARGLFDRAILQSGAPVLYPAEYNEAYIQEIAAQLDIPLSAKSFADISPERICDTVIELRKHQDIVKRSLSFLPVIDDEFIPADPMRILQDKPSPVPLIVGYTATEFALWSRVWKDLPYITWGNFSDITERIKPELYRIYENYYKKDHSADDGRMYLLGDFIFSGPCFSLMKAQKNETYAYIFSWENPANDHLAFHVLELPFVFDTLSSARAKSLIGDNAPQELADHIHKSWIDFIRTGNPGWETFGEKQQIYNFTYPIVPADQLITESRAELLNLWKY